MSTATPDNVTNSINSTRQNGVVKAVIPAAGLGTRLRPLTRAFPKELLPIGREPVLAAIVTELREAGITDALFIVSDGKPQIRAFFGDVYTGERSGLPPLRCAYVTQTEQRGVGDALLYAQKWVGASPFVVAFGDCIIEGKAEEGQELSSLSLLPSVSPLTRLIAAHVTHQSEATALVEAVERAKVSRYGVVASLEDIGDTPQEAFALADIVEKPAVEAAPSRLVVAARWVLQPTIFAVLQQTELDARGERNITDAVRALLQSGKTGWAVPLQMGEARRDIGNFESFFAQFVRTALRDPEFGKSVQRVAREELARSESDPQQ
jgi:UTP--glucose-1-phosphate uridylyltransferase